MDTLVCSYCGVEKSMDQFPLYEKKQWKICIDCKRKKSLEWHYANRDRALQTKKKRNDSWYSDPSNRERARARQRKYHREHREQAEAYRDAFYSDPSNRETKRARDRQYAKDNPEGFRRRNAKRRALKKQVLHEPWTHSEIAAQGTGFCPYCGKEIGLIYDSNIMHIDHVIPISRGGPDLVENLEPVCAKCNLAKNDKTKEEFLNEKQ
jgi:5-methylcytosine-specific restriction endonuclease McrA